MLRPIDVLIAALTSHGCTPKAAGKGWRARCPACEGRSDKLSIGEMDSGACMLHCFGGCDASAVLMSCGLSLADLYPPRIDASTPEGRKAGKQAMREAAILAAIATIGFEAKVLCVAGSDLVRGCLSSSDLERARVALKRVDEARQVLNAR